nr:MAG TPA: hypothetical protein [Caudoviricetes sp.]
MKFIFLLFQTLVIAICLYLLCLLFSYLESLI